MKTYLNNPIKIPQFLSRGKNSKMLKIALEYSFIFNIKPPAT